VPELPEVETTRRGLLAVLPGRVVRGLEVTEGRLRSPISPALARRLEGRTVTGLTRRGKYLLIHLDRGGLLVHLGMSGSLRLVPPEAPLRPHDRWSLLFTEGAALRMHDPRRFSLLLYSLRPEEDPRIRELGPEPLETDPAALARHLRTRAAGRRVPIKVFLMDGRTVAGIGNIYANEALYRAGIRPRRPTGRVRPSEWNRLVDALRAVLGEALESGGSTLRDYLGTDGSPGYFRLRLEVYDRADEGCRRCGTPIHRQRIAGRSSYYCPRCQR
jgi:formamidopyrimidine-DNA glycosylase